MITIRNQTTRQTAMLSDPESLADFCATDACLARTAGIYLHEHATSFFRFVREHKEKVRPSSVVHGLAQPATSKPFYIQIFDRNQSVLINDLARLFMMEVASLIANMVVESLKQQHCPASPVRTFLASRRSSLQTSEFGLCGSEPARILNLASIAERCEMAESDINPDSGGIERQRATFTFNRKDRKPMYSLAFYREGLNLSDNGPMEFDSDVTDAGQPQFISVKCIPNLTERNAVIAPGGSEPRIAGLLSRLHSAKESIERQLNTFENVFKYVRTNCRNVLALFSDFGHLKRLVKVGNPLSLERPRFSTFLERRVVKLRADCKLRMQRLGLCPCGVNAVTECLNHEVHILPLET